MNKNYTIHPKHFHPMNHALRSDFNQYLETLNIKEGQDVIAAYCIDRHVMSFIVFDYENNKIHEYDTQTGELLAMYHQSDLIRLKPITEFFKNSLFVPTLNRHETMKTLQYSFELQDQLQDVGSLYFLQEDDPQQVILSSLKLGIHHQYQISDKLAIFGGLFQYFDFKISRQYDHSQLTFMKVRERIKIQYHGYQVDVVRTTLQEDILLQKHAINEEQTISFHLRYDDPLYLQVYVSQCIKVLVDIITLDSIPCIVSHIRAKDHFLHWFKEDETHPSDNPSK